MAMPLSRFATTLNPETIPTSLGFVDVFRCSHMSRFVLAERLRVSGHRSKKGRSQKLRWCSISSTSSAADEEATAAESLVQRVNSMVLKQAALVSERLRSEANLKVKPDIFLPGTLSRLDDAYDRCREVCAENATNFYLGTLLLTPERRRAMWAIGVWCRRTDDLVDGPNASLLTPHALDRWESKLEELFEGRPFDAFDAALSDTVAKYPVDIQPFKDLIEGMRMDLRKSRYKNFDELYLYCYYVAGTVGLISVPVCGIAPDSRVLSIKEQNILQRTRNRGFGSTAKAEDLAIQQMTWIAKS